MASWEEEKESDMVEPASGRPLLDLLTQDPQELYFVKLSKKAHQKWISENPPEQDDHGESNDHGDNNIDNNNSNDDIAHGVHVMDKVDSIHSGQTAEHMSHKRNGAKTLGHKEAANASKKRVKWKHVKLSSVYISSDESGGEGLPTPHSASSHLVDAIASNPTASSTCSVLFLDNQHTLNHIDLNTDPSIPQYRVPLGDITHTAVNDDGSISASANFQLFDVHIFSGAQATPSALPICPNASTLDPQLLYSPFVTTSMTSTASQLEGQVPYWSDGHLQQPNYAGTPDIHGLNGLLSSDQVGWQNAATPMTDFGVF